MHQLLKKTALIVFSVIFITGTWLSEAGTPSSSTPGQKISEEIKKEVDELYDWATYVSPLAADILERAYQTEPEKRQDYITAIKEHPWPEELLKYQPTRTIEIEFLLELLENPEEAGKYFERLEAKKAGKIKVSAEVRQDVEQFFERINKSGDPEEREEAYDELRDESIERDVAHEYVIALKEHPWPEDKELRELVEETLEYFVEDIDEDHFSAEVQPRIDKYREEATIAEVRSLIDAFFSGITSSNPCDRKEAISKVFEAPGVYIDIKRFQQYINEIRKHPWPEDEVTKRKIEMVLEVLEDQNDFFTNRWEQVSSSTGKAGDTRDKLEWIVGQGRYNKDYWPSIIQDKNRKPLDRFYAAYYLAEFYVLIFYGTLPETILFQVKTKTGKWEYWPEEWSIESLIEAGNQSRSLVLRLCADEDKEVSFLMQLGLAHQRYFHNVFPGRGDFVPAAIDGLENNYLYFRLLSQDHLEQITGQKFDLDPTDPAELRAPAIARWQKWWEENKDKLHYDVRKRRLVQ